MLMQKWVYIAHIKNFQKMIDKSTSYLWHGLSLSFVTAFSSYQSFCARNWQSHWQCYQSIDEMVIWPPYLRLDKVQFYAGTPSLAQNDLGIMVVLLFLFFQFAGLFLQFLFLPSNSVMLLLLRNLLNFQRWSAKLTTLRCGTNPAAHRAWAAGTIAHFA